MNNSLVAFWAFVVVLESLCVLLCMIPSNMAKSRGRSSTGWFTFTFLLVNAGWLLMSTTLLLIIFAVVPLVNIIILACLGDTEQRKRQRIIDEERLRMSIRGKYSQKDTIIEEESTITNPSGKTINDLYRRD